MNAKSFVCALLTAALLLPAAAFAEGKDGGGKHRRSQQFFEEVGITPEQEAKLREIHAASVPAKNVYKKHLEVIRAQIKQELQKENPSKRTLNKYAADMGDLHRHMNLAFIEDMLKIKAILTPEQFARLSERGLIGGPEGIKMHKPKGPANSKNRKDCGAFKPGEGPKHRYGPKQGGERPKPKDIREKKSDQRHQGGFQGGGAHTPPPADDDGILPIEPPLDTPPKAD